jgi:hypothetical protein
MNPSTRLSAAAQIALLAVAVLGLLVICLVATNGGFTHSDKRGITSVFVPAPEAYLAAVPFLAMSILALAVVLYGLLGYLFYTFAS